MTGIQKSKLHQKATEMANEAVDQGTRTIQDTGASASNMLSFAISQSAAA